MPQCQVCECWYRKSSILPESPDRLCTTCIQLRSSEYRFHPYILLEKVRERGSIDILSKIERFELVTCYLSGKLKLNTVLCKHLIEELEFELGNWF